MAAKAHVDSSVAERRLRPIYDWLDNGNNKRALQEAEKVLKKQPNFLCAKVLKALALLRTGKDEECKILLESVREEVPIDDPTLQAMSICYREMHQAEKICNIYAAAVTRDGTNEELLTHLFMSYVRVGDYKNQQKTALALYKLKSKNPYYFWGVMSIVMQAHEGGEDKARSLLLPLAERMVYKMVESGRMEAEQEVQLYLMILEMQGKLDEALQVLEGPLGSKLVSYLGLLPTKKADLLGRLGRWKEAHLLYKQLLESDHDRWSYYMDYFNSTFKLWTILPDEKDEEDVEGEKSSRWIWEEADNTPQSCAAFLAHIVETNEERGEKRLRGPLLARLELYRRLQETPQVNVEPRELLGDIVDLLMTYFKPFAGKPCCFSDLRNFLPLLPAERVPEFIDLVKQQLGVGDEEMPKSAKELRKHISVVQLSRYLSTHENIPRTSKVALARSLLHRYDHGAQFNQEVTSTDFPCHDPYAVLASHVLLDLWWQRDSADTTSPLPKPSTDPIKPDTSTNEESFQGVSDLDTSNHLVEAAAVLEHALILSPSNFHIKLLLQRIYTFVGAGTVAQSSFEQLDVKHMQLDSLGWLHCAHLSSTGVLGVTSAHYEATLKFFTGNYKDSVDHLTFSYKFGSFLKIEEFVKFRERLNNSHHYARCTVEKMLLDLVFTSSHEHATQVLTQMDVCPAKDTIAWDKLRDNRDLQVIMSWDPPHKQINAEFTAATFKREVALLRLRSLQLRCIAAAFEVAEHQSQRRESHAHAVNGESINNCLPILITQLCHFYLPPAPLPCSPLCDPTPSRAQSIAGSPHVDALVAGLRLTNQLSELSADPQGDPVPVLEGMVVLLGEVLKAEKRTEQLLDKDICLATRREALEETVNTLETLGFVALLCGVYDVIVQPVKTSAPPKKGKKKKEKETYTSPVQPRILCGLAELACRMVEVCKQLSDALNNWETRVVLADDAADRLGEWSLSTEEEDLKLTFCKSSERRKAASIVRAKLHESYSASIKELHGLLSLKVKHFSCFTA